MAQLPLSVQQVGNAYLIHKIEGIRDGEFNESDLFLGLQVGLLELLLEL